MKKLLSLLLIICLSLSLFSCAKKEQTADRPIISSDYEIVYENDSNYMSFSSADELFDFSDYVVVASPIDAIQDSKQVIRDKSNNDTTFENASATFSYTKRIFKIEKIYKGEDIEQITVGEHIIFPSEKDLTAKALQGEFAAEKGERYLLFLNESNKKDLYFTYRFQGKYPLSETKDEQNKQIDQNIFKSVKQKFSELFK